MDHFWNLTAPIPIVKKSSWDIFLNVLDATIDRFFTLELSSVIPLHVLFTYPFICILAPFYETGAFSS